MPEWTIGDGRRRPGWNGHELWCFHQYHSKWVRPDQMEMKWTVRWQFSLSGNWWPPIKVAEFQGYMESQGSFENQGFMWLGIITKAFRARLCTSVNTSCALCGKDDEDVDHLFFKCDKQMWNIFGRFVGNTLLQQWKRFGISSGAMCLEVPFYLYNWSRDMYMFQTFYSDMAQGDK